MEAGDVLMYPVSQRFLDSLDGSHEMVARARICTTRQFTINPSGTEVPILDGDVKISRTADIKRSLALTIPGEYWELVQPYGAELFIERGIDFGDGTQEYVPLGYFRIQEPEQPRAPRGPIDVKAFDRNAQLMDHRRTIPVTIPGGTTHRQVFQALVNAQPINGTPLAYRPWGAGEAFHVTVPIFFDYNPDTTTLNGDQVWEQSAYEFLARLAESKECVLSFGGGGDLSVTYRDQPTAPAPVWTVRAGEGGNLLRIGRRVTRDGVYNFVVAYGSDPASPTGYRQVPNADTASPLWWQGLFGPVVRFYASPLIRTNEQGDSAGAAVLARYANLPVETEVEIVPNPALRPNDLVTVAPDGMPAAVWQVDELTIPLVNGPTSTVKMITSSGAPSTMVEVSG